jgi:type IV pilus assembly protein PilC
MSDQNFSYEAFDASGTTQSGLIEARSQDHALELLSQRGLTVNQIKPVLQGSGSRSGGHIKPVDSEELAAFAYELSALLQAGLSLAPALELLVGDDTKNPMSVVTLAVLKDVRAGTPFSQALEKYPEVYPAMMSSLVRAGEGLGGLDKALAQTSEFLENADKVRNRVVSAMAYPVAVSGMAFALITGLFLFMVPRLKQIYAQIGVPIPPMTQMMLEVGQFADDFAVVMLVLGILGLPSLRAYFRSRRGQAQMDALKLRIPLVGGIFQELALASFNKTLAILHSSGLVLHKAVDLAAGASGNAVLKRRILETIPLLQEGKSLATALATVNLYNSKMLGMIEAGEKSGNLAQMLTKMAEFSENRCQHRIERLMALLEPLTIGFLGLMVGGAVLVLGAPLLSLSSEIH